MIDDTLFILASRAQRQSRELNSLLESESPGIFTAQRTTSIATALDEFDGTLFVDTVTAVGAVVVSIPTAVGFGGRIYVIKDSTGNAAVNNINFSLFGAETIDGAGAYSINTNYGYVMIQSDGTNWLII